MMNDNIFEEFKAAAALIEEVQVTQTEVILRYKNERVETYQLEDLSRASIITTADGPFRDDVFWLLLFKTIVMIPQGVPGEDRLLGRLQELEGFNNEAVIEAMASTEANAFHVYGKESDG